MAEIHFNRISQRSALGRQPEEPVITGVGLMKILKLLEDIPDTCKHQKQIVTELRIHQLRQNQSESFVVCLECNYCTRLKLG